MNTYTSLAQKTLEQKRARISAYKRMITVSEYALRNNCIDLFNKVYDTETAYKNLSPQRALERFTEETRLYITNIENEHIVPAEIDFEGYAQGLASNAAEVFVEMTKLLDEWKVTCDILTRANVIETFMAERKAQIESKAAFNRGERNMLNRLQDMAEEGRKEEELMETLENEMGDIMKNILEENSSND